ncbi:hypothetical protein WJX73_000840 [Symbiochloris irregularis]|uniref:Eukaryotic translation initiation factor 3 subunit C n=1 Tax=Symbiochloris irregularis TaxID=706552 RepID=A0AAW1NTT0_9CHLO
MASRLQGSFWAQGSDSEDEEPSEEEESSSEDSDSSSDSEAGARKGASKFLVGSSDSDSSDDKRVVRSAKDRRYDELRSTCDEIRNKLHINDWNSIQTLFDKLNKQLEKTQKVTEAATVPRVYIKLLVELEDSLLKTLGDREAKKKMSPTNAKALNTMRQRLKKHNLGYAEDMDKFRANPESTADESSDSDDSDSDDGSGSDEDVDQGSDADGAFEKIKSKSEKKKDRLLSMDPKDISYEMVSKKLQDIMLARGKKGVDRQEQVEMLTYLTSVAKGPCQRISVMLSMVSAIFDINPSMSTHMPVPLWKRCVSVVLEVLSLLSTHTHIVIDDSFEGSDERTEEPSPEQEAPIPGNLIAVVERLDDELFKSLQMIDPHTHQYMDRLKDEPVFLAMAAQTQDIQANHTDQKTLARLALRRMEHFYHKTADVYEAMRKITMAQQQADAAAEVDKDALKDEDELDAEVVTAVGQATLKVPADFVMEADCEAFMESLSRQIYEHGDERTKARAMLCTIFFKAIREDFYGARDMMLMSHLQDNVQHMDISTQILFNRAMAQLGLCAFRKGLVPDAHSCLSELYTTGRVKELLAQGMSISRYQDKTPEQEKLERRRQMPFHMHINLELLESVHLISAMLLEVPVLAAPDFDPKKRPISKPFRRLMDNYERQTFTGPPENVRDHVMAATRALLKGEWQRAYAYLSDLPSWNLLAEKDKVLHMIQQQLKEEGLRTYLLTYGAFYHSLSHQHLSQTFDLPDKKVHSIISKMMMAEQLAGSWDQPTGTVVMHAAHASRLQAAAGALADKATALVDLNERALSLRTGGVRDMDDDREGGRGGFGEDRGFSRRGGRGGRSGLLPGPGDYGRGLGRGGGRGNRGGLRSGGLGGGMGRFGGGIGFNEGRFPSDRFSRRQQAPTYDHMTSLGRVGNSRRQ